MPQCMYEGCKFTNKSQPNLENHQRTCIFGPTVCSLGCDIKGLNKKNVIPHMRDVCPCRYLNCENCERDYMFKDTEEHDRTCEFKPMICEHCKGPYIRKVLEDHYSQCPKMKRPCAMAELGCPYKDVDELRVKHESDANLHFKFLAQNALALKKELSETKKMVRDLSVNMRAEFSEVVNDCMASLLEKMQIILGSHRRIPNNLVVDLDSNNGSSSSSDDDDDNKDEPDDEDEAKQTPKKESDN